MNLLYKKVIMEDISFLMKSSDANLLQPQWQ